MDALRVTVILVTITALLALAYYTVRELLAALVELTTLSHLPLTAVTEKNAYMLLVHTIAFGVLILLLLVVIVTVLHFTRKVL
jgi:hypothetical protein